MLLVSIDQHPVLGVALALLLEEAMKEADCTQVLKSG